MSAMLVIWKQIWKLQPKKSHQKQKGGVYANYAKGSNYSSFYLSFKACKLHRNYTISSFFVCEKHWVENDTLWCGGFEEGKLLCVYDYKGDFYYSFSNVLPTDFIKYWNSFIFANQQILQSCSKYSEELWKENGYKGLYQEFIVVLPFDSCYILKLNIEKCIESGMFGSYEKVVLYNILTYFKMFKSQCALICNE